MQFDARAAKQLTPGTHLTIVGCPGLRLVATESRRTWTYRFKSPIDGNMRQVAIGWWPEISATAAGGEWEKLRAERDAGRDPALERKATRAEPEPVEPAERTVRMICDEHLLGYKAAVTHKTWAELDRLFRTELGPIEHVVAATVTRSQAYDLINGMRDAPVNAKRVRQALGSVWDEALDAGRLPPDTPNWWRLILRGKLPSKGKKIGGQSIGAGKRVLSEAEITTLIPWLPNFSRDVDDVLTLYLWTCCRGAEIVTMERDEITREASGLWWTVPVHKLKMRRNPLTVDLRVPLVGRALKVVERRLAATPGRWLFPSPGKKSGGHIQQKAIGVATWSHMPYSETRPEWVRPRLPVVKWAPHDLRRTGRTVLASLGCPENIAEAILGHMPPGVKGIYDRYGYDPQRRIWLTKLSKRLEALASKR